MRAFDEAERVHLAQFLDIDALFAIDWTKLSYPGVFGEDGSAFPSYICNLTSPDPTLRRDATWALHDLQDDLIISDLTAKAVPFLLHLVSHPDCPARNDILEALWSITDATRYQIESKPLLSSYACIDPPEPDELVLLQEVHQMIAEALPMLIALLAENPDAFFSDSISALRACEPTIRKTALPVLRRLFAERIALSQNTSLVGTIARALIAFAFPQANPEELIAAIDREQQQILAALCAYDPIWKEWRWETHLKKHGLPGKREHVLALCDVSPN